MKKRAVSAPAVPLEMPTQAIRAPVGSVARTNALSGVVIVVRISVVSMLKADESAVSPVQFGLVSGVRKADWTRCWIWGASEGFARR
ncbi:hypothetical protein CNMCM8060_002086 [Aspergillus lentulus]|nr:hypothetical protein CNMCM8060_002086 [Aspergillus lentulus]KAF4178908.1 hypothetical protein CNMCM7927_002196 [Aspergillus lentulus]